MRDPSSKMLQMPVEWEIQALKCCRHHASANDPNSKVLQVPRKWRSELQNGAVKTTSARKRENTPKKDAVKKQKKNAARKFAEVWVLSGWHIFGWFLLLRKLGTFRFFTLSSLLRRSLRTWTKDANLHVQCCRTATSTAMLLELTWRCPMCKICCYSFSFWFSDEFPRSSRYQLRALWSFEQITLTHEHATRE